MLLFENVGLAWKWQGSAWNKKYLTNVKKNTLKN
jgi:hypothetical protein